jgi:hypothetical protein
MEGCFLNPSIAVGEKFVQIVCPHTPTGHDGAIGGGNALPAIDLRFIAKEAAGKASLELR